MASVKTIDQLVGNTPLVRVNKLEGSDQAEVLVKLESFNPLSSVKDRLGIALIADGESKGLLTKDSVIVEPTSGNTGIALAYIAAARGYKLTLTMPETMSIERRNLLKTLGAELVLTPGEKGMKGAIEEADRIKSENPNAVILGQFTNPANPDMHFKTTGPEIWKDTEGKVDIFVAGVGTGGTLTGVGKYLKSQNPNIKIVAVEPDSSPVLSGGKPGPHKIQGIGAGFIPSIVDTTIIDEVIRVVDLEAGAIARTYAKTEGVLLGISAGANILAALELAKRPENKGKTIVTIGCDTGERYLSTWLFQE